MEYGIINNKFKNLIKKIVPVIFIIYMVILFAVLVLKIPTGLVRHTIMYWADGGEFCRMKPQLVPFKTIIEYLGYVHAIRDWFFKNLACNIIMFIPYGFMLPYIWQEKARPVIKVFVSGILLSVCIEAFQYITALGQCDIDDVILNTLGIVIGVLGYKLIIKIKNKNH